MTTVGIAEVAPHYHQWLVYRPLESVLKVQPCGQTDRQTDLHLPRQRLSSTNWELLTTYYSYWYSYDTKTSTQRRRSIQAVPWIGRITTILLLLVVYTTTTTQIFRCTVVKVRQHACYKLPGPGTTYQVYYCDSCLGRFCKCTGYISWGHLLLPLLAGKMKRAEVDAPMGPVLCSRTCSV